jgi:hypothetical protein
MALLLEIRMQRSTRREAPTKLESKNRPYHDIALGQIRVR